MAENTLPPKELKAQQCKEDEAKGLTIEKLWEAYAKTLQGNLKREVWALGYLSDILDNKVAEISRLDVAGLHS